MKEIKLTQGYKTIIDDDDFERVNQYKWKIDKVSGLLYARRNHQKNGKKTTISLHRFLMGDEDKRIVDHVNGDGLDNRRANLRFCSMSENMRNRRKHKKGVCNFKGIHQSKNGWVATVVKDRQKHYVGYFKNELEAAKAYDNKAQELHGEFACLNFS